MRPSSRESGYDLYTLVDSPEACVQFSPFVWKTIIALRHLDIPFTQKPLTFDGIRTDLAKETGDDKVLVPVLKNEQGEWMKESFDIALNLDSTHAVPSGKSLFLQGEAGKEFCRFVEVWSNKNLAPELGVLILPRVYDAIPPDSASKKYFLSTRYGSSLQKASSALAKSHDEKFRNEQFTKAKKVLSVIETMLEYQQSQGKGFIGGEFSYADAAVFGWYLFSTRWVPECEAQVWGSMRRVRDWVGAVKALGVASEEECNVGQGKVLKGRL